MTSLGSSAWDYVVPFREDLQGALDALREQVFAASEEYREEGFDSLDDLLASGLLDEQGAHSVLDVDRVVRCAPDHEDHGDVRVVEGAEAEELFGTPRPAPEVIRRALAESAGDVEFPPFGSGSGCCTVAYAPDGNPESIFFWGSSGD